MGKTDTIKKLIEPKSKSKSAKNIDGKNSEFKVQKKRKIVKNTAKPPKRGTISSCAL